MTRLMGILNATPDSYWKSSRIDASSVREVVASMVRDGAGIIDVGAVSTRPGADSVSVEEEWSRLRPVLEVLSGSCPVDISIDTTSSTIVRLALALLPGGFMVNDISAGENDAEMLPLVGSLGLPFIAMHRRGGPCTMDGLADYPSGVVQEVLDYFSEFSRKAALYGITDWTLDPGFGFAKTDSQNMELLASLGAFKRFHRPILVSVADKRFVRSNFRSNAEAHRVAVAAGADILRVHDIAGAFNEQDRIC